MSRITITIIVPGTLEERVGRYNAITYYIEDNCIVIKLYGGDKTIIPLRNVLLLQVAEDDE